jgi:tripartite-type tricarboxylate transporter receptor subunit TctC
MRTFKKLIATALLYSGMFGAVQAQDFPSSAVTIVVPFSSGGAVDLGARNLAEGLSKVWGKPVVVENKPGAGSLLGTAEVAKAKPNGLTLLYVSSAFTANAALKATLPYDPFEDFVPISSTGDGLSVVAVGSKVKSDSLAGLIEESKKRTVFFATSGNGSFGHLASEALNVIAGAEMKPVHYKSGAESILDVAGGRTDVYVGVLPAVLPFIQDGRIRILATFGKKRAASLPNVPTMTELGYKDAEISSWWGLFAPKGTPEATIAKINADVANVLQKDQYKQFLDKIEAPFFPSTPAEFRDFVVNDVEKWKRVVKARGISEN